MTEHNSYVILPGDLRKPLTEQDLALFDAPSATDLAFAEKAARPSPMALVVKASLLALAGLFLASVII